MKKGVVSLIIILSLLVIVSNINNHNKIFAVNQGKYTFHTVRENECLSIIAEKYKGKYEKTSNFITDIKVLNGLSGDDITAGKTLIIPRRN